MKNFNTLWLNNALITLLFFCFLFLFYMIYNIIFDRNTKERSFSKKDIKSKKEKDASIFLPNNILNKNSDIPIIVEKNVIVKGSTRFEYVELNNGKIIIFNMTDVYESCPNDVRFTEEIDSALSIEQANNQEKEKIASSLESANDYVLEVKAFEEKSIEEQDIDKAIENIIVVDPVLLSEEDSAALQEEHDTLFQFATNQPESDDYDDVDDDEDSSHYM